MSRPPIPPLVFEPQPLARPWGGTSAGHVLALPEAMRARLEATATAPIGEWWLLSTRPDHPSRVASGPLRGHSLSELVAEHSAALLGTRAMARWRERFPVLVKILDTAEPLSIQVHPADADLPGEGKTETWYALEAQDDACFFAGLREGCTPAEFFATVRAGRSPETLLARHAARPGTVVHLPPGMIHALGRGIVALEVQTSADTTYRIWDWDRLPRRELHIDAAQRVTRADQRALLPVPQTVGSGTPRRERLIASDAYILERFELAAPSHFATDGARFEVLVPLRGGIRVTGDQGGVDVPRGHAVLVPAETGDYVVSPDAPLELLRVLPGVGPSTAH